MPRKFKVMICQTCSHAIQYKNVVASPKEAI